MSLPLPLHPDAESVAVAWCTAVLPVGVATSLPKLPAWSTFDATIKGFGTVSIVGGRTFDYGLRESVVSLGTWAAVPSSDNPQWGAAAQMAEIVIAECLKLVPDIRIVQKSAKYAKALIHTVRLNAEPRRILDPDASMAHFETEFRMMWTEQP